MSDTTLKLYHYTRALRDDISTNGLIVRNKQVVRDDFISRHGGLFSEKELETLKLRWNRFQPFDPEDDHQNGLHFTRNPIPKANLDTQYLTMMFGGEAVTMVVEPYDENPLVRSIFKKLSTMGEPMEIVINIAHDDPDIYDIGPELRVHRNIHPEDILSINNLEKHM
tara:strand:+ start:440 stop:940 length:501 start_codon:yes stop_codon:yes gene_type:complete